MSRRSEKVDRPISRREWLSQAPGLMLGLALNLLLLMAVANIVRGTVEPAMA